MTTHRELYAAPLLLFLVWATVSVLHAAFGAVIGFGMRAVGVPETQIFLASPVATAIYCAALTLAYLSSASEVRSFIRANMLGGSLLFMLASFYGFGFAEHEMDILLFVLCGYGLILLAHELAYWKRPSPAESPLSRAG